MNKNWRKLNRKTTLTLIMIFILNVPYLFNYIASVNFQNYSYQNLKTMTEVPNASIVSGSEVYAEQISAYVAGSTSIIRQSYITNDSNMFKNFDYKDPGFTDCSVLIASSNGITPNLFPQPMGSSIFSSENFFTRQPFFGFLYYNTTNTKSNTTIIGRANRALNVIRETFKIDLIMLNNSGFTNWYPFIGYYPDWNNILTIMTYNTPKDGYWGALDIDRLKSSNYLNNNHISTFILMLTSMELIKEGLSLSEQYFGFDLTEFSFSFMQETSINNVLGGLLGLLGVGSPSLSSFGTLDINSFINGGSYVLATVLQYEGHPNGIIKQGNNYEFDLSKAMNYNFSVNGSLKPSNKIFNGLIGALLTEIDISVYNGEITSWSPETLYISDYLKDTINTLAFLSGQNIDISLIQNYSFGTYWNKIDCVNNIYTNIKDYVNPDNPINFIWTLLRNGGINSIPTGLINPIDTIIINYNINYSEPSLSIKKDFVINSLETGDYYLNISIFNQGNTTAWGKDIFGDSIDLTSFIPIPIGVDFIVQLLHPEMTVEEYLGIDENPRFFLIDSFGSGLYDTIIPNVFNLSALGISIDPITLITGDLSSLMSNLGDINIFNLLNFEMLSLYSPMLVDDIITLGLFGATESDRPFYTQLFANPDSIFNKDNWKIEPGETYSYQINGLSLLPYYSFNSIYTMNFSINGNLEPYISIGSTVPTTNIVNAQISDGVQWNVTSSQIGDNNYIQVYFTFKNDSLIDLVNNTIDRIDFNIQYLSNLILTKDNITIEFYNHSAGEFQQIPSNSFSLSNQSIVFSALSKFEDYLNQNENYTSLFKINLITSTEQNIGFDCINLTLSTKLFNLIPQNPAYILYQAYYGQNGYILQSNNIVLPTRKYPILESYAQLTKYNSYPGESNKYLLSVYNIGDESALSVNISVPIPGKIKDKGNFDTIIDNKIELNNTLISPSGKIDLWFDFYTPNSLCLPEAEIKYTSDKFQQIFNLSVNCFSNELILSAPIDYSQDGKIPFIDMVQISYQTNYSSAMYSGGDAPQLGDLIQLNITFSNPNVTPIDYFEIVFQKYIMGFEIINPQEVYSISNLIKGFNQKITVILNKTAKTSYYYPGLCHLNSSQDKSLRYTICQPLIFGYGNILLQKTWSDLDGVHNSLIYVTINITNTGNIVFQNLTISDIMGFPKEGFSLYEGSLSKFISEIEPGQSIIFQYILRVNQQGLYNIKPSEVKFYYLYPEISESNSFIVKVRNTWINNALWILIPSLVSIGLTLFLYRWKHRYDRESAEFERREELMFGSDLRTKAWDKYIIEEHLNAIMEGREISSRRNKEEVF